MSNANATVTSRSELIELVTAAMARQLPLTESLVRQMAIIAIDSLACLSCALPSAATIESWIDGSAMVQAGHYALRGSMAVECMLRANVGPVLAAQTAEVAALRVVNEQHQCARSACIENGIQDAPLLQDMIETLAKQRNDAMTRVGELEQLLSSKATDTEALEMYRELLKPFRCDGELAIQTLRRVIAIANDWREANGVWSKRMGDVSLNAGRDVAIHSTSFLAVVKHGNATMSMCNITSIDDAKKIAEQIAKKYFAEHIGETQ